MATARELLDIDATPRAPTPAPTASRIAAPHEPTNGPATFRSAYRFTGSSIVVLDQRELPGRVLTFECQAPNEVAASLRSGAITPGPVMGQVAAYGVALAATQAVGRNARSHEQFVRTSADAIKAARGDVHAVRAAVARIIGRYDELANAASASSEIADSLTAEADEIATEAAAASAELGRRWSELLVGEELNILVHGDSGPLACGMVGMSTSALQSITAAGRRVHVWITDASPSGEGTRVMALELTQLDIPHTVIPDSAVGWLFANRAVDAAALRGDTITSNGDSVALLGARAVAQLAADRGVPVHVLAPEVSWDRAARDASHLVLDMRSAAELGSAQRARLNPAFDIVPARLVSAYVSERAVVSPPFKEPR